VLKDSYLIKNNPDHKTTTRTNRNLLAIAEIGNSDLEPIATGTRVMIDLQRGIEGHVFDFDLIVDREVLVVCHIFFFQNLDWLKVWVEQIVENCMATVENRDLMRASGGIG
jgi:hypothetical protein